MNLKQLEIFLSVAQSGSFSKGAEANFITQSTASQHISALEKELSVRLLDRTSKGALPTAAGQILVKHTRLVLADMREIHAAIDRFKGIVDVALTVGASSVPGQYLIPKALPVVYQKYPGLTVTLLQGDSYQTLERVRHGEAELGVVGNLFDEEGFTFTPIGSDEIRLIVPPSHRWAGQRIFSRNLPEEPFILRETGSGTGKTVTDALRSSGIDLSHMKIRAYLGSNEAIKEAVASGLGVAFLSNVSVQKELAQGTVATATIVGLQISRSFQLVFRTDRELSPAAHAFADVMQTTAG